MLRLDVAIFWPGLTLMAHYLQAPAKRSQHFDATYHNIVGRNMLRAFGHHVATCEGLPGGGGGVHVPLFPRKNWSFSLVPQK